MSAFKKCAAWLGAAALIGICFEMTAVGQGADVATATAPEAPAQSLAEVAAASGSTLTPTVNGHWIHIFPHKNSAAGALLAADTGPLVYHAGGSIMPRVNIFNIYWKPATLQSGATAVMDASYQTVLNHLAADYVGHGIHNNNTQYYQTIGTATTYVSGLNYQGLGSSLGGTYLDTAPYPTSQCTDPSNPKNCITDAQLQTELLRVMALKGWTGGLDKIYLMYTAGGEDSCTDTTGTDCSYNSYCAYHSNTTGTVPVIYGNEPYGDPSTCGNSSGVYPNDPAADTAADTASHEISEAVTDPLGDAWFSAAGNEIGDLCIVYGTATYDAGKANQRWNGHFYELQAEFDNHKVSCQLLGP